MSASQVLDFIQHTDSGALYGKPGLKLLHVETPLCRAVIAEQGAQILEFQAVGRTPLLWLSPAAVFESGRSVRGGIPLCLPWFGINQTDPAKPKHGLVRGRPWKFDGAQLLDGGKLELAFSIQHQGNADFAAPFGCRVKLILGLALELQLELENRAEMVEEYSWAWHTYFPVHNVHEIEVCGLDDIEYLDNSRGLARARQNGVLRFPGEVDRVFEYAPAQQQIVAENSIVTESEHCHSVITWNPGPELAAGMADVGAHYRDFVCVEHGNAFANSWQLAAGESVAARLVLRNV